MELAKRGLFGDKGLTKSSSLQSQGMLSIVPTPIGNLEDLSFRAKQVLQQADVIACEDTRHTRILLNWAGIFKKKLLSVHKFNETNRIPYILDLIEQGYKIALVTDAGMPSISDPGSKLINEVIEQGMHIEVLPGPSAVITALVASGMDSTRFCFEGFLPRKGALRKARLKSISLELRTTVLFESPHRIKDTLCDLEAFCGGVRKVAVVKELTKIYENVWRGSLEQAIEKYSNLESRGEHVLVLEANMDKSEGLPSHDDIAQAIQQGLKEGKSLKDVVSLVAIQLSIPKRQAYEIGIELKKS